MIISVITPVYNRADSIERCMASVKEARHHLQASWGRGDYKNISIEHIVVDDGSNDNTSQIVRQYADKHNWIVSFPFLKTEVPMPPAMQPLKLPKENGAYYLTLTIIFCLRHLSP